MRRTYIRYLFPAWFYFILLYKPFYPAHTVMGREIRFCPSLLVDREQVRERNGEQFAHPIGTCNTECYEVILPLTAAIERYISPSLP